VTVYSTFTDVERIVNPQATSHYDASLLDRDCKLGVSFHSFDIEKFGADKVITISMVPEFNHAVKVIVNQFTDLY